MLTQSVSDLNAKMGAAGMQGLTPAELEQVEGGEVTTMAVVGAVALGAGAVVACAAAGALIGWGLYELLK